MAGLCGEDNTTCGGSEARVLVDNFGGFREQEMGLKNFDDGEGKEDEDGKWEVVVVDAVVVIRQDEEIETNSIFPGYNYKIATIFYDFGLLEV